MHEMLQQRFKISPRLARDRSASLLATVKPPAWETMPPDMNELREVFPDCFVQHRSGALI